MNTAPLNVLHIGGSASDARRLRFELADSAGERIVVEWLERLPEWPERPITSQVDAVILDTQVTGRTVLAAMETFRQAGPDVPILVVGAEQDPETTRQIMLAGAADYLLASRLDGYWLRRALQHAIQRKLSEIAAFAQTQRTTLALNSFGDAFISTDATGCVTSLNGSAEAITGWPHDEALGRPLEKVLQLFDAGTREAVSVSIDRDVDAYQAPGVATNCILIRRDGSESAIEHSVGQIYDRRRRPSGAAVILRDISAARAVSRQLTHLASHDGLTDLPNRRLLSDRLERALALAHRHYRRLAVLFVDIDRFKHINDSLGHLLGDQLLRAVGRVVTTCVRSSDTVGRYGGDEFVAVLTELEHAEDAAVGARKIIAALVPAQQLAGHDLHITVSIGISVYPDDGRDAGTLLKNADMALYDAKSNGRDCYQFFKPDLNVRALERRSIEEELHNALDRQEFELFYQPRIDLRTDAVVGAEALIRWRHPTRGLLEPAQFVGIAEDCGLIRPIGRWVLYEACRQATEWQDAGFGPMPVAVNISAIEFRCDDFLTNIVRILTETSLAPGCLEIEITESALMAHVEATTAALHALKALGLRLSIDDFGTGWSSLSHLSLFPVDTLKIDKSFVQAFKPGSDAASIVSAVISLGRSLKYRVVAEGVETREQLTFLRVKDCDEGQGYYFNRPLIARQFAKVLEARRVQVSAAF
jgi:diguanylate cyclase (GGDEF)-like protein/PAS domain S-box-containing protein